MFDELYVLLADEAARWTTADWMAFCDSADIPCMPVIALDEPGAREALILMAPRALGLGVSHHHLVDRVRKHDYSKPYSYMVEYLERMDKALFMARGPEHDPGRILAALGQREGAHRRRRRPVRRCARATAGRRARAGVRAQPRRRSLARPRDRLYRL